MLVMMMPGVVASLAPHGVRVLMRAAAGAMGHGIVRQMAQRRGRRVEGQQPPAKQIAKTTQHIHQLKAVVRLLSLIAG